MKTPGSSARLGRLHLCVLLSLFPCAGAGAEAPSALLSGFIAHTRSFEADFVQTLFDQDGNPVETWRGKFWLRRPGQFRWRYDEPFVQEIVGDGRYIWQYDQELKQLVVDYQKDLLATAPTRFLFDRLSLSQFEISEIGRLGDLRLVQLEDRRRDTAYEQFLVAFRDGVVATIEMRDSFDQVTRIAYSDVRVNKKIDDSLLRLPKLPGDVDVLDRTLEESAPARRVHPRARNAPAE